MTSIIEFEDVARSYKKGQTVLDGVTFSINQGEVVGLLGCNGAGKTTLIRIAMGMLYPQRGSVRLFGTSMESNPVAIKRRIGYVAEDQVLPASATIGELITLHRALFSTWDDSLESQILDRCYLTQKAKIRNLSKGQARQVALLCALCHRPELLILDEPAGGLDPVARREFLELSIQLLNLDGTTILFSSHQMTDVERMSGRIVLLDKGKVQLDRSLDSLREETSLAFIPRSLLSDFSLLERMPECLHVRLVSENWHAIIEGTPEQSKALLENSLGIKGIQCARLPLEELFIEMASTNWPRRIS